MPTQILKQLSGPLSQAQIDSIRNAVGDLSAEQLTWLSGYLAGVAANGSVSSQPDVTTGAVEQACVTVLYGSQTGNASGVANQLLTQLQQAGHHAELHSLADYNPRQLKKESYVALVVSTHGEGEPPDDALAFHEFIQGKKAPKLDGLKYSVLALGDSSYEQFCQTGKELDERFTELGAQRLHDRIDCDVDYQGGAKQWVTAWQKEAEQLAPDTDHAARPKLSVVSSSPAYSKFEPYTAEVLSSYRITGRTSGKVVNHVEILLEDSGLTYQPGDALGIWPENDTSLVDEVLQLTGLDGDAAISIDGDSKSLREALTLNRELTQVHPGLVEYLADGNEQLTALVAGERRELLDFIHHRQVVELLKLSPRDWTAQELVDQLRGMTPRLYSIASSNEAVGDEVHLTVGLVADERDGEVRFGAASHFLSQLNDESTVRVFVEPNRNFKLPENGDTPVIMVGPGTGIAPFRSFMQEREAAGTRSKNWLFFGNPHFHSDFLYQTDWQAWHKSGLLTRIDLAFSRDQAEKIYVQDRMREQAAELFAWLEQGAHFYVCGDQTRMAKSVDEELHRLIAEQSGKGDEFANEYVAQLKRDGRYQRDVY